MNTWEMSGGALHISFRYSFDTKQLIIFLNKTRKLVELKLNITNLNNLNVNLNTSHHHHHHHQQTKADKSDGLKINELVYIIADELVKQHNDDSASNLLKCYFEIDNEFKNKLTKFLADRLVEYYRLKFESIRGRVQVEQLKEYWLRMIDQNNLAVNEPNLTSINTLGKSFI